MKGEAALPAQHGVPGAAAHCRATSGHLLATWGSTSGVPATALIALEFSSARGLGGYDLLFVGKGGFLRRKTPTLPLRGRCA